MSNKFIDNEYFCYDYGEMSYLSDKRIRYTFVKEINGITCWKYKKTSRLFEALACFYRKTGDAK